MSKEFRMLVNTEAEANILLRKFDMIGESSRARKTPNGKWIIIFSITVK